MAYDPVTGTVFARATERAPLVVPGRNSRIQIVRHRFDDGRVAEYHSLPDRLSWLPARRRRRWWYAGAAGVDLVVGLLLGLQLFHSGLHELGPLVPSVPIVAVLWTTIGTWPFVRWAFRRGRAPFVLLKSGPTLGPDVDWNELREREEREADAERAREEAKAG